MAFRPIQIVGYTPEGVQPRFDDTEICDVDLHLSEAPPPGWIELWHNSIEGPQSLRARAKVRGDTLRLEARADLYERDIEAVRTAIDRANKDFLQKYRAVFDLQEAILTHLDRVLRD